MRAGRAGRREGWEGAKTPLEEAKSVDEAPADAGKADEFNEGTASSQVSPMAATRRCCGSRERAGDASKGLSDAEARRRVARASCGAAAEVVSQVQGAKSAFFVQAHRPALNQSWGPSV